jgi:hypothetical protein
MKLNKKYTIAWILWVLIFIYLETMAIIDKKKGDTLTEHVRELATLNPWQKVSVIGAGAVLLGSGAFCVWWIPHILGYW